VNLTEDNCTTRARRLIGRKGNNPFDKKGANMKFYCFLCFARRFLILLYGYQDSNCGSEPRLKGTLESKP
jgi:hypothetical protein